MRVTADSSRQKKKVIDSVETSLYATRSHWKPDWPGLEEKKMFAVIETGGKQYRVTKDSVIDVEKLAANPGESIDLTQVLLVSEGSDVNAGKPYIDGAVVKATVVDQFRGKKVRVFKMKPKKRYRRLQGHRQYYTRIRIDDIVVG